MFGHMSIYLLAFTESFIGETLQVWCLLRMMNPPPLSLAVIVVGFMTSYDSKAFTEGHLKKTCSQQPSITTWPLRSMARKCIKKIILVAVFLDNWQSKPFGWQPNWFVYLCNSLSQVPTDGCNEQSFLLVPRSDVEPNWEKYTK